MSRKGVTAHGGPSGTLQFDRLGSRPWPPDSFCAPAKSFRLRPVGRRQVTNAGYLLRRTALLRFRRTGCAEEAEDDLRRVRRAVDFAACTPVLVLNGRTTLLASATTTPSVEPIFLATPSSRVPSGFSDIAGSFFGSPVRASISRGSRRRPPFAGGIKRSEARWGYPEGNSNGKG